MSALRALRRTGALLGLLTLGLVAPVESHAAAPAGHVYFLDGVGHVHAARPDGSGGRELELPGWVVNLSVSPDGRWLALVQQPSELADPHFASVWVVRSDLTGARRLLDLPGAIQDEPSWSPDSKRLVVTQGYPVGYFGIGYQSHLWVVGRDGSSPHPVVVLPGAVQRARWAPRGDAVAFTVDSQETSAELGLVHVDATPPVPRLVTQPPAVLGADKARWSPDARTLSYMDGSSTYVLRPDGSGRRRVGSGGSFPWDGGAAWSPDGRRLAVCASGTGFFFGGAYGDGFREVSVTNGRERVLDGAGPCFNAAWSPDGRWVVYGRAGAEYASLVVLDTRTGRTRVLADRISVYGIAWGR